MKKVFFVIVAIACAGMLSAQDTIYPFRMDYMDSVYPIMKDSTSRFIIDEAEDLFGDSYRQRTVWGYRIMVPPKTEVWGLNVSTTLDWHSIRDSVEVRGVVIQVLNDDYNNPICHFTNPLKAVSHRPYDLYWAFDHPTLWTRCWVFTLCILISRFRWKALYMWECMLRVTVRLR